MLLATDAQHAKEVALGELERVRAMYRQEAENRKKLLAEKKVSTVHWRVSRLCV